VASKDWTSEYWATKLKCAKSTVVTTPTWKQIMEARAFEQRPLRKQRKNHPKMVRLDDEMAGELADQ